MVSLGHAGNIGGNAAITKPKAPMPAPISIILPTLNAAARIGPTLAALSEGLEAGLVGELIIVDGGSDDDIAEIAAQIGAEFIRISPSRGGQLAAGAGMASRPWLLFIHADTVLSEGWTAAALAHIRGSKKAGYFALRFDAAGFAPWFVAGWANMRARVLGLPYGDQGLLISAALYQKSGGYPDQPLMEDVALARRLRGDLAPIRAQAVTSAEKYEGRWLRRGSRNLALLIRYFLGTSPEKLAALYRK